MAIEFLLALSFCWVIILQDSVSLFLEELRGLKELFIRQPLIFIDLLSDKEFPTSILKVK